MAREWPKMVESKCFLYKKQLPLIINEVAIFAIFYIYCSYIDQFGLFTKNISLDHRLKLSHSFYTVFEDLLSFVNSQLVFLACP